MIKVDSFSFQGVNGAYSEQAGKNIFPNGLLYLVAQPKNPLVSNYELCWSLGTHRKMDPITYEKSNQLLTIPPIPYTP